MADGTSTTPPRALGSEKRLFLDDALVAGSRNVAWTMNPPRKTGERCIVAEHPWESFYAGGWNTVLEDDGVYKLWYEACSPLGDGYLRGLCYATSRDGVHWEKPPLGLIQFNSHTATNLVATGGEMGSVFLDPRAPEAERFKYVEHRSGELYLHASSDGLRWHPYLDRAILKLPGHLDTQNQIFWDSRLRKYVSYVRINYREPNSRHRYYYERECQWRSYPMRKVGRTESDDLGRWPPPEVVLGYDDADPERTDHYNMSVVQYPWAADAYLMFPSSFYHYYEEVKGKDDGPIDIQCATSRDGITWDRRDRRPYVRLGLEGSFDGGSIYMSVGMVRKEAEIWMYYTAYDFTHAGFEPETGYKGVVSRLVQRLDGFFSVDAGFEHGELTTVPLTFTGRRLELNLDTGALGSACVALQDEDGRTVDGFSLEACDPIRTNSIARTVTWRGSPELGGVAGRPVRLTFALFSAKLFAFQFRE